MWLKLWWKSVKQWIGSLFVYLADEDAPLVSLKRLHFLGGVEIDLEAKTLLKLYSRKYKISFSDQFLGIVHLLSLENRTYPKHFSVEIFEVSQQSCDTNVCQDFLQNKRTVFELEEGLVVIAQFVLWWRDGCSGTDIKMFPKDTGELGLFVDINDTVYVVHILNDRGYDKWHVSIREPDETDAVWLEGDIMLFPKGQ